MTDVRIAHAEPRPGRLPDGTFAVGQILVVLADDPGRRAMAVWLTIPDGDSLWRLLDPPPAPQAETPGAGDLHEETANRLLHAAGAVVTAVEIDVRQTDTGGTGAAGTGEPDLEDATARIELASTAGIRFIPALPGYALALAVVAGAQVRVASDVLDRLGRPAGGDDVARLFLPAAANRPASLRAGKRWRFEPRNLSFGDGLEWWDLDGSFLRRAEPSHLQDYTAQARDGSAVLSSAVQRPGGSARLEQTIFADDYRGATLTLRGDLRAEGPALEDTAGEDTAGEDTAGEDTAGQESATRAGLFLRVHTGGPLQPPDRDPLYRAPAAGPDWARPEVTATIPASANVITFGIFLSGPGRIWLRGIELTSGA
jgi:hypothetical protein